MSLDPVILFFTLGLAAGLLRSDLKIPAVFYEALSIFLLLAIGLKGGVELARLPVAEQMLPALTVIGSALLIPLVAFVVLRHWGGFKRADAASIAAHYGSVSVVTFAVGCSYLAGLQVPYEDHLAVYLVLLEVPALLLGVVLARRVGRDTLWRPLLRELFAGKSILLLLGGLCIGYAAGTDGIRPLDALFFDLFKGVLAFFLLEMGLVVATQLPALRQAGRFLFAFALLMPLAGALLGLLTAQWIGLSLGGSTLLATLFASASYIAAPAAMRVAVPEANPALAVGAALGVTFPFNLLLGIPAYYWLAQQMRTLV